VWPPVWSHRLEEVFELGGRATVLRDGRHVITAPTSELTAADLVRYMVGRSVSLFPRSASNIGNVLLDVKGLTRIGAFRDVTFSVRAGEIVGLSGLSARVAQRLPCPVRPSIEPMRARCCLPASGCASRPRPKRLHAGVAYVPEDRHLDGLVAGFSIAENISLPIIPRLFPHLFIRGSRAAISRPAYTEKLRIRRRAWLSSSSAIGREPAESGHCQMAGHGARVLIPRRAYSRRRHRREGGGPSDHLGPGAAGWGSSSSSSELPESSP